MANAKKVAPKKAVKAAPKKKAEKCTVCGSKIK